MLSRAAIAAALILLLAACSRGTQQPSPPSSGWSNFANNQATQLSNPFSLQSPPLIAYIITAPRNLALNRTITLNYTVFGSGSIATPNDEPPAQFRLFIWQNGDNFSGQGDLANYRAWCSQVQPGQLTEGDHILSCALNGTWTGVLGRPLGDQRMNQVIANVSSVGFTCGGRSFAGKGCSANNVRVRINEWSIR
jgi:hypothetical protein